MEIGIEIYTMVAQGAVPIGLAFAVGDLIVTSFLKMALKGRVEF